MLTTNRSSYNQMSLEQLADVPITERGTRSDRWLGVSHYDLTRGIIDALDELFGVRPYRDPNLYVSPNGNRMYGSFELGLPVTPSVTKSKPSPGKPRPRPKNLRRPNMDVPEIKPMEIIPGTIASVGFRHANDSSTALHVRGGGRVCMCWNGLVMILEAEPVFRRHTSGLILRDWLMEGLQNFIPTLENAAKGLEPLQAEKMTPRKHDEGMLQLARSGALPWKLLGPLDSLWTRAATGDTLGWVEPDVQDDWEFEGTKWDWYNGVTATLKDVPVSDQLRSLQSAMQITLAL